jgi:hypothetical protein
MPRPDCPDCGARTGPGYVCPQCQPARHAEVMAEREKYFAAETREEALRVPPALQEIPFFATPPHGSTMAQPPLTHRQLPP